MEHVFRRFTAGVELWKGSPFFLLENVYIEKSSQGFTTSRYGDIWGTVLNFEEKGERRISVKWKIFFTRWIFPSMKSLPNDWWLKNALQDSYCVCCQFVLGNWFPCLAKFGTLLLRHFIPFEKLVRFRKTSDNLRLQNILTSSSLAVEIQNASSEISRTFRHGLSPRLEKLATAWAQLLSSALSCHHLKFRGSLFARPVHFHRVSVTTPLLTLPMIHGLLLELRHLTAKTSFLG